MTEIEKLRQLKQQREKMKERQGIALAPKEKEKPAGENTAVTVCPECGSKKPEATTTWDCPECGNKGIFAKFCPECGHKREG